jgi:hypothetical protein
LPYASDIDDIDDQFNGAIDAKLASLTYPLFVVTLEGTTELVAKETPSLAKPNAAGYLVLKGIRLRCERDGWSHEELELWYGKKVTYTDPQYPAVTSSQTIVKSVWRMNGVYRPDATGTSRYFSDVNKKHKWYADQGYDARLLVSCQLDIVV